MTFNITKRKLQEYINGTYTGAAARGIAMGTTDEATFKLADGTSFRGFLIQATTTASVPSLATQVYGRRSFHELPQASGEIVSVEDCDEWEAGGTTYLVNSGTGEITANTALGTPISFYTGKARVAQTGEFIFAVLDAILTTADADGDTVFRFVRQTGAVKAS